MHTKEECIYAYYSLLNSIVDTTTNSTFMLKDAEWNDILTALSVPIFLDVAEPVSSVGHRQVDEQPVSVPESGHLSPSTHVPPSLPGSEGGSDVLSSPSELLAPVDVTQLTPQNVPQDSAED